MALHQAGRLDEAEKLYQQILAASPGAYPALHLMGVLRLMQNREFQAQMDVARQVMKKRRAVLRELAK